MLRHMFGEPRRTGPGLQADAVRAIQTYLTALGKRSRNMNSQKEQRLALWSKGFIRALDELEQSVYCADRYGQLVTSSYIEEMSEEEQDNYHRHVYYYKNAFIRLFSILDKLGYFANELFELNTERVKARFSYFTVLREMRRRNVQPELERRLFELKTNCKPQLDRLRNQRNMEIHTINADLLDDLMKVMEAKQEQDRRMKVENIADNLSDLQCAFDMTTNTVQAVFSHISK